MRGRGEVGVHHIAVGSRLVLGYLEIVLSHKVEIARISMGVVLPLPTPREPVIDFDYSLAVC